MNLKNIAVVTAALLFHGSASAVAFDLIRIGDIDGFGFTSTAGLQAANGSSADTNGNNLLQQTEFLPDLNTDGSVATGSGDDYDNRSMDEMMNSLLAGSTLFGNGFTDAGSSGVDWTDVSLSTSAPNSFVPDGNSANPNEPVFIFDFFVAAGDIVPGSTIFFNLIFGDYDVTPANVDLTFASAPGRTIGLTTQGGGQDGLIQAATLVLDFNEVFTPVSGGFDGFVRVDFDAPNEPYTVFDFAELSLDQIPFVPAPVPASLVLLLPGLMGLRAFRQA